MHVRTAGALAAIVAAFALAYTVGVASARSLVPSHEAFRITWTELKFFDEGGARLSTTCPVTMEGSFSMRTILKVPNSLIGMITRAVVKENSCTEGPARFLQETLPWHLRYAGFSGTLPAITRIRVTILNVHYEDTLGVLERCLFRGEATPLAGEFFREAGGVLVGFEFLHSTTLPPSAGSICATSGITGGLERLSTSVTVLNSTTRITVTLI